MSEGGVGMFGIKGVYVQQMTRNKALIVCNPVYGRNDSFDTHDVKLL
jgi:hypothetical protein